MPPDALLTAEAFHLVVSDAILTARHIRAGLTSPPGLTLERTLKSDPTWFPSRDDAQYVAYLIQHSCLERGEENSAELAADIH